MAGGVRNYRRWWEQVANSPMHNTAQHNNATHVERVDGYDVDERGTARRT